MQLEDSADLARAALIARLRARSREIEEGVLIRASAIGGPSEFDDPEYALGFHAAVPAAIDYGLTVIASREDQPPPVPPCLLTQARVAARHSVSLETVIRRYVAGRDELSEFLVGEVEAAASRDIRLANLLGTLSAAFDHLLAELDRAYELESRRQPASSKVRLAERVKALLAGRRVDTSGLDYDFAAHHLGIVTEGEDAPRAVRTLAKALDGRVLLIHPAGETVWAWIGMREPVGRGRLDRALATSWPEATPLGLGEAGTGISGWRLSNKQAQAVFPFALHREPGIARYVEDALLTSMARDEVLVASLREIYLAPLERGREGGAVDRETLCAYFAAGRNGRAAAAALDVSRQTVSSRLRAVEKKIGRSLLACAIDLELALRLADRELI